MPALLRGVTRRRKVSHFLRLVPRDARILDVGCGDGWLGRYAIRRGWPYLTGIDIAAPAVPVPFPFVHGDVNRWYELGLSAGSFDVVIAFDVLEYGDLFPAIEALLRPGGLLLVTTPVPAMDQVCSFLESAGLTQRRSGTRTHLIDLRAVPGNLVLVDRLRVGGVAQWGVVRHSVSPAGEPRPSTQSRAAD